MPMSNQRITGTVKWFNKVKGFGFISPDGGGPDNFVHVTALHEAGLQDLEENQRVEYEVAMSRGKPAAMGLKLV